MSQRAKLKLAPLLLVIPALWISYLVTHAPRAIDFYPLYFAAQRVLVGQSPYGAEASHALRQLWQTPFIGYSEAGVAYPLPLILLIIPLTLLTFPLAATLWTAAGALTSYLCVLLARQARAAQHHPAHHSLLSLLLPFTFYPFYRGVELGQATLVWFGLAVLLAITIRRHRVRLAAVCIVLLLLKPQNGLIFAAYGLYWLLRHHRSGLLYVGIFGIALLGVSLLIQPDWIRAWLQQVATYRAVVQPPSLLPVGIVTLVVFWRFDLWVKVVVAQVILFPLSDVYSTLPLLLAWYSVSPPVALFGAGISWLWILLPGPTPLYMIWLLIFMPLIVAALWEKRPAALRREENTGQMLREQPS